MAKPQLYVSTDVEADGSSPGPHSMLSFGSVALDATGVELSSFMRNRELLPGASGHPSTTQWWERNQAAWDACRVHPTSPELALVPGRASHPCGTRRCA